ncbi:MAG: ATP-binding protein [Gammaproteobacteria bacterium]|nr:ATP-binding protein [Gammaproteobacteria bacterium]
MRIRLTLLIPALLLLSVLVSSSLIFYWQLDSATETIRRDARHQLNLDITRLQNILYYRLIEDDITSARMSLSVTAMDRSIKTLILINGGGKVLLANRYSWQGKSSSQIRRFDENIAAKVKINNKPFVFYPEDNRQLLSGYYPVILKLENQSGHSIKKLGVLFAEFSIDHQLSQASQRAVNLSLSFFLLMGLATFAVAVMLHILVSKRLAILTRASKSLADGDFDTQVKLSGQDELGVLAKSFNEMARQIKKNIKFLESAEHQLQTMNETLEHQVESRTALLSEAQRIAQLGNWVWYVKENTGFWSDEIYRILGLEKKHTQPSFQNLINSIDPDDLEQFETSRLAALQGTSKQVVQFRIVTKDGVKRWVNSEIVVLFDEDKNPEVYKGVIQDIHSSKLEKQQHDILEKQLQQSQKMESLGHLTGGIAHDFNNMLAAIIGFTDLATKLEVDDKSGKLVTYLDVIMKSSERAKNLVSQMLTFSRSHENIDKKEKINIKELVDETLTLLKPILPSSISLNVETVSDDVIVIANNVMLGQVLMNLCVNARDAMQNSQGEIKITISREKIRDVECASCHHYINGDYVQITISDNGVGISAKILAHIFEPFFTTKGVGEGTGMGLSMVHGIMHKHNGHLRVFSKAGQGSSFHLLFPVTDTALLSDAALKSESDLVTQGRGEKIMLVDDEVSITLFMEEYLTDKGYQVISLNDSQLALDYLKEHMADIDLMITDYTMPGMTGMQLALEALDQDPSLPVIMSTGYSDYVNEAEALKNNLKGFLSKPVDMGRLLLYIKQYARKPRSSI